MGRHFRIKDDIYRRRVFVFVGSRKELVDHLTVTWGRGAIRSLAKDAVGMAFHFKAPNPENHVEAQQRSRVYYVWLSCFCGAVEDIGTLAHECFHAATMILDDLGVDTDESDGSEALAYYLDFLVRSALDQLSAPAGTEFAN